jgi:hypothetical protein
MESDEVGVEEENALLVTWAIPADMPVPLSPASMAMTGPYQLQRWAV